MRGPSGLRLETWGSNVGLQDMTNPGQATRGDLVMNQRAMNIPSPRVSALAFTEGARSGWIASDLVAWMKDYLAVPRRLDTRDGQVHRAWEHGFGVVPLDGPPPEDRRNRVRTASQVPLLIAAARDRVIQTLRVTVRSGETAFVNAALYAGRVSRERGTDGKSCWHTYVTEEDALSDQVLALFAADALTYPADYEHDVAVCDACGAISFQVGATSRHGCVAHPYGSLDGKPGENAQGRVNARS